MTCSSTLRGKGNHSAAVMESKQLKRLMSPAVSLLGMYPKEIKSTCLRDSCTLMFTAVRFAIAKIGNQ